MLEKARRVVAVLFFIGTLIAGVCVPLYGLSPLFGLALLAFFLTALAAKPEPGRMPHRRVPPPAVRPRLHLGRARRLHRSHLRRPHSWAGLL